jgi:hypothetical protein
MSSDKDSRSTRKGNQEDEGDGSHRKTFRSCVICHSFLSSKDLHTWCVSCACNYIPCDRNRTCSVCCTWNPSQWLEFEARVDQVRSDRAARDLRFRKDPPSSDPNQ